jgi:hypothetical protein
MKTNLTLPALALTAFIGTIAEGAEQLVEPSTLIADTRLSKHALESLSGAGEGESDANLRAHSDH